MYLWFEIRFFINDQLSQPPTMAIEKIKPFKIVFLINDQLLGRSYRFELFGSKNLFESDKVPQYPKMSPWRPQNLNILQVL